MKSELTDKRRQQIKAETAVWTAIAEKWGHLGPYDPVPSFTKAHAEKMIQKLDDEVTHGTDDA